MNSQARVTFVQHLPPRLRRCFRLYVRGRRTRRRRTPRKRTVLKIRERARGVCNKIEEWYIVQIEKWPLRETKITATAVLRHT